MLISMLFLIIGVVSAQSTQDSAITIEVSMLVEAYLQV